MKHFKRIVCLIVIMISISVTYGSVLYKKENNVFALEEVSSSVETEQITGDDYKTYYVINKDDSVDSEQIKYDTIIEVFGDFDSYMNNDDITLEEIGEYREILFCRLRDAYSKSNRNMIELIENECGPVEVQFLDVYSPLCIIKMSDTQAYILSDSNLPVYIEPFINIAAELE